MESSVNLVRDKREKNVLEGRGSNLITLPYGAMLYRLKRYDEAADTLGKLSAKLSGATDQESEYILTCADYFLAMARYQLGHKFQARRLLDAARTTAGPLKNDADILWSKPVVLKTLEREAKELIEL
jgi:hypothetical protein